jgi:uncharacterized DUF497 family protein
MLDIQFEYDQRKNLVNQRKHHVSFEEAKTIFYDEHARLIHDPEHSLNEDRFIILGLSANLKLLVVVHTYKKENEMIRIISARKATENEIHYYHRNK